MFVVCCSKGVAELSHFPSEMAASQRKVGMHSLVIYAPASLIWHRRHILKQIEVESAQVEGHFQLLLECYVFVSFLGYALTSLF